jgi:hypothetical protein
MLNAEWCHFKAYYSKPFKALFLTVVDHYPDVVIQVVRPVAVVCEHNVAAHKQ